MQTPIPWIVGAYAAAPSRVSWDPAEEKFFYDSLADLPGVAGFEVPFADTLHKVDEGWLLHQLPRDAVIVITAAPGMSDRVRASRTFGLASTDSDGREAAVRYTREANRAVHRLNDSLGTEAVVAIELHSAPVHTAGASDREQLLRSLSEIMTWDWGGARVVIEHCDAAGDAHPPAKGYLSLEDEILAVTEVNRLAEAPVGIGINWGRSVIEARDPDAGRAHVERLRDVGLLAGLMFSGCSDSVTRFGGAWADVHAPVAPGNASGGRSDLLEPTSLLTSDRIVDTLLAAGPPGPRDYRGIKVAAPPTSAVADRVAAVAESLDVIRDAEMLAGSSREQLSDVSANGAS